MKKWIALIENNIDRINLEQNNEKWQIMLSIWGEKFLGFPAPFWQNLRPLWPYNGFTYQSEGLTLLQKVMDDRPQGAFYVLWRIHRHRLSDESFNGLRSSSHCRKAFPAKKKSWKDFAGGSRWRSVFLPHFICTAGYDFSCKGTAPWRMRLVHAGSLNGS